MQHIRWLWGRILGLKDVLSYISIPFLLSSFFLQHRQYREQEINTTATMLETTITATIQAEINARNQQLMFARQN